MRRVLFALGITFFLALFTFHPFAAAEIASAPASTADGLSVQRFRPSSTKVYRLGHWFRVEYRIKNTGEEPIHDIEAVLGFSNENLEAVVSAGGEKSPRTKWIEVLKPRCSVARLMS